MVAVKQIFLESKEEGLPSTSIREISILKQMNHPYIVKLKDVICVPDKLHLVFDYVETDLKTYVEKHRPLSEMSIKRIMF
jgi:cyclin-dependent kinase 2